MKDLLAKITRDERFIIGLMSGTSTDGVDAALLAVRGAGDFTSWEMAAFTSTPYPDDLRAEILAIQDPDAPRLLERIARLHFHLGDVYAESCAAVAKKAGMRMDEIHLCGMHGQTVFHGTGGGDVTPATLQLGEAQVLAERTGLSVVSNFRARDVAAGGTGAPLVPYVDYLLFRSDDESRLCLNIGGIANFSALPRGGSAGNTIAFDTGPGNMVIDALVARYTEGRETYDRGGARALSAAPNGDLVTEFMAHEFILDPPPKSAGREEFGAMFAERFAIRAEVLKLTPAAAISTATELTVRSIVEAYRLHVLPKCSADRVLVSGGGVHNHAIMGRLGAAFDPVPVQSTNDHGLDPDAKEAVAFALLANETIHGRAGNLPSVTGARHPVVLGAFVAGGGG